MEDQEAIIETQTPDVETEHVEECNDKEENEECSQAEVQALAARVNYFSLIMERFFPLLERLDLQETSVKKKSKKSRVAETPKKTPGTREPEILPSPSMQAQ